MLKVHEERAVNLAFPFFAKLAVTFAAIVNHFLRQTPSGSVSVGEEAANAIDVTLQLQSVQGRDLEQVSRVSWWLSDTAGGAPTANVPATGTAVQVGTALKEHTAEVFGEALTNSAGLLTLRITEAGGDTWYVNFAIGNTVVSSAAVTFTA